MVAMPWKEQIASTWVSCLLKLKGKEELSLMGWMTGRFI
jgi:hypothetical protein